MITTYIPYAPKDREMNLGAEYNRLMRECRTEWACFLDHDAMFLHPDWYHDLTEATEVAEANGIGLMSCMTNRIGTESQLMRQYAPVHDIKRLRQVARLRRTQCMVDLKQQPKIVPEGQYISGVMLLVYKMAWEEMSGFADGFLGVDYDACDRMRLNNWRVGLLPGIMVYHWYRGDGNRDHVTKANTMHVNPKIGR